MYLAHHKAYEFRSCGQLVVCVTLFRTPHRATEGGPGYLHRRGGVSQVHKYSEILKTVAASMLMLARRR